jgi:hypothetical protein
MAQVAKVLGQSDPLAATLTVAYTVPASTQAIISTINIANRSATATSFRVSIAVAAAADTTAQYLYYDVVIAGNDTFQTTAGFTLGAGDVIRVYATLATLSFNISGVEIT